MEGPEFRHFEVVLRHARTAVGGKELTTVSIRYGAMVNAVVEFLIVALTAFLVVKVMNRIIRSQDGSAA